MDQILHTYLPNSSYLNQSTSWSLVILIFCVLALFFNFRRKVSGRQGNIKNLISMLLGFLALIAIGSALFSSIASKRIGPVMVYADRIKTTEGTIAAKSIKRAYIHESKPTTPFRLNELGEEALLLIIEEKDGRTSVFSEENYDINQMMKDLKPWLKKATGG